MNANPGLLNSWQQSWRYKAGNGKIDLATELTLVGIGQKGQPWWRLNSLLINKLVKIMSVEGSPLEIINQNNDETD